ncbi:MAG: FAD-dependent oxidoreductase [Thermoguttaceae bacterium]|nr:FAD-dependent oxidoreductase [Thermoguttaceae bacterium]
MKNRVSFVLLSILLWSLLILSPVGANDANDVSHAGDVNDHVDCDVLVVGGSGTGATAAIQSARLGVRTILLEISHKMGGTNVTAGVTSIHVFGAWNHQIIGGIPWEIMEDLVSLGGARLPDLSVSYGRSQGKAAVNVQPDLYSIVLEDKCLAAGVELRYFEAPSSVKALQDDSGYHWQVITSAMGKLRQIRCREMIDCTGNGTLCAMAGAQRMKDEKDQQPGTFSYHVSHRINPDKLSKDQRAVIQKRYEEALENGTLQWGDARQGIFVSLKSTANNYIFKADNSTAELRSKTNTRGRQSALRMLKFIRSLPGGEDARLMSACEEVGIRETWRVKGEYVITIDDCIGGTKWADSIAYCFYPVDPHVEGPTAPGHLKTGVIPTIPFRALVPKGIDHLQVAGRCISSDHLANSSFRVQATCMAGAQATGAAAALAVRHKTTPLKLDMEELKSTLRTYKAIIP